MTVTVILVRSYFFNRKFMTCSTYFFGALREHPDRDTAEHRRTQKGSVFCVLLFFTNIVVKEAVRAVRLKRI